MATKLHVYEGRGVKVTYDAARCIHAAECVRGLPTVFDPQKRPWVSPDQASAAEVAAVVERCPTGALQVARDAVDQPAPETNTVAIVPDGPLYLRGELEILAADGSVLLRDTRMALCRCGGSKNKPFCDNTHRQNAFKAPASLSNPKLQPGDGEGPLRIKLAKNGPLILEGPMCVRPLTGGDEHTGTRTGLCRCGGSDNKPFCDGSHVRIGFQAAAEP